MSLKQVRNSRDLLLVDNLSVCLSFERKRSRNYKLLCQIRKFSAYCFVFNIKCSIRWIPSEANCSDDPSRQFSVSVPSALEAKQKHLDGSIDGSIFSHLAPIKARGADSDVSGDGAEETCSGGPEEFWIGGSDAEEATSACADTCEDSESLAEEAQQDSHPGHPPGLEASSSSDWLID